MLVQACRTSFWVICLVLSRSLLDFWISTGFFPPRHLQLPQKPDCLVKITFSRLQYTYHHLHGQQLSEQNISRYLFIRVSFWSFWHVYCYQSNLPHLMILLEECITAVNTQKASLHQRQEYDTTCNGELWLKSTSNSTHSSGYNSRRI